MRLKYLLLLIISVNSQLYSQNSLINAFLELAKYENGNHTAKFNGSSLIYGYTIKDSIIDAPIRAFKKNGRLVEYRNVRNNEFEDSTIIYSLKGRKAFIQIIEDDTLIKEVDSTFHFLTNKLFAVYKWDKAKDTNFHLIDNEKLKYFYKPWNGYGQVPAINGTISYFFKNGNIKRIVRNANSKRHGKTEFYRRDGTFKKGKIYYFGERVAVTTK
ncbi:hypothetical protein [Acidiluteibacter ferrifornacis]|uniref:MORN repeat variant n=1 Tax=Acidiluteibacter ferrifornacis TaxID=2692424 RepID=A0A6N9NJQ9_9FLAO|nr:hypothetical protein [Acidiluteibacter ferrifornacis]NBG65417.1 hypothetical protein [Acidiluteibacter ferrifornacis]